jgi:hypothetical protein
MHTRVQHCSICRSTARNVRTPRVSEQHHHDKQAQQDQGDGTCSHRGHDVGPTARRRHPRCHRGPRVGVGVEGWGSHHSTVTCRFNVQLPVSSVKNVTKPGEHNSQSRDVSRRQPRGNSPVTPRCPLRYGVSFGKSSWLRRARNANRFRSGFYSGHPITVRRGSVSTVRGRRVAQRASASANWWKRFPTWVTSARFRGRQRCDLE